MFVIDDWVERDKSKLESRSACDALYGALAEVKYKKKEFRDGQEAIAGADLLSGGLSPLDSTYYTFQFDPMDDEIMQWSFLDPVSIVQDPIGFF